MFVHEYADAGRLTVWSEPGTSPSLLSILMSDIYLAQNLSLSNPKAVMAGWHRPDRRSDGVGLITGMMKSRGILDIGIHTLFFLVHIFKTTEHRYILIVHLKITVAFMK